ncbi:MAG: hypothetical protein LBC97_09980 [Bifidobacteriaceae bacterium]|jgi:hypothetical protein|nr:hypothetical protein [Bifidobacteriaceae bacterium]
MQLSDHFDVLLKDTVNLSRAKLDLLQIRADAVSSALMADTEIGDLISGFTPQGSWAHRTIINPQNGKEFDADILLDMDEVDGWEAKDYIEQVYRALGRHGTYSAMPHTRKCRCVRLTYANSMHIDIVPHLHLADGREVIVNRDLNEWETTNPTGFTDWMRAKDSVTDGNLRKVIRLVKYLRDHKNSFTGTPSIIITTLLGDRVDEISKLVRPDYYGNVPKALLHLISDLDAWLQQQWTKPSVADPSSPGTTFDHRWEDASYEYFRNRVHAHAAEIAAAYSEPDKAKSVELWQGIFGSGFAAPATTGDAAAFGTSQGAASTIRRPGRAG